MESAPGIVVAALQTLTQSGSPPHRSHLMAFPATGSNPIAPYGQASMHAPQPMHRSTSRSGVSLLSMMTSTEHAAMHGRPEQARHTIGA